MPPIPAHRLMSLTGLSLGGVLASKNRLRFTRRNYLSTTPLNDVLAHNSLNDVVALKSYLIAGLLWQRVPSCNNVRRPRL
jgi:hypothetical protein